MVKQSLKKQPTHRRGTAQNPDLTGENRIPAEYQVG
jgi:hypothetical protein